MLEHLEKKLTVGKYVKQQAEVNLTQAWSWTYHLAQQAHWWGKKDITSNDLKIRR